jgi:maltose O-acetyltransferase
MPTAKVSLAALAEREGRPARIDSSFDLALAGLRRAASEWRNSALQCTGHIPGYALRAGLYRMFGMEFASGARIAPGCWVLGGPGRIRIGAGTVINRGVVLDGRFPLTIGGNVSVSIQTIILTLEHDLADPNFRAVGAPVEIQDRAFLGARSLLLPGVTVGEGAAVAAGAVVTKDVEPYTIVAGVPAKAIGSRPRNLAYRFF